MPRFWVAVLASLITCAAFAQGDPSSGGGPTTGPSDPPSPAAAPSETALSPDGAGAQPVPGDAPSAAAASPAASPRPSLGSQPGSMILHEGDVVAGKSQDGKVRVMKIVKINYIEGERLLHSIAYKQTFHSWEEAAAAAKNHTLTVMISHLPIDGEGLTADANRVLANEPITEQDLSGYREYVKEVGH